MGFPGGSGVKASAWNVEDRVRSLGWEDPLEKEIATHWRIPWREEPGRLSSVGSQRVRHDWATSGHDDDKSKDGIRIVLLALLCTWCLYLPQYRRLKPNLRCAAIWRGSFGEWLGHEDGVFVTGISALWKRPHHC